MSNETPQPRGWQWLDTGCFRKFPPKTPDLGAWNPLFTAEQMAAAVAAERERCAKLVETLRPCMRGDCDDLAAAIRG
jgi:hypothetical protein